MPTTSIGGKSNAQDKQEHAAATEEAYLKTFITRTTHIVRRRWFWDNGRNVSAFNYVVMKQEEVVRERMVSGFVMSVTPDMADKWFERRLKKENEKKEGE